MRNKSVILGVIIPIAMGFLLSLAAGQIDFLNKYMWVFGFVYIGLWIWLGYLASDKYSSKIFTYFKNLIFPAALIVLKYFKGASSGTGIVSYALKVSDMYMLPLRELVKRGNIIPMLVNRIKTGEFICPGPPSSNVVLIRIAVITVLAFAIGYSPDKEKRIFR